jgi:hypothetical protein
LTGDPSRQFDVIGPDGGAIAKKSKGQLKNTFDEIPKSQFVTV